MPSHTSPSDLPIFNVLRRPDLASILKNWVGEKIFQRGADYFKKNRVRDLVITKDASLLATVKGSRDYVSSLRLDEDDKLNAACTCPYDGICKHVVALSLAGREALMAKSTLPSSGEFDFRPEVLASIYPVSAPLINQTKLKAVLAKLSKEALLELLIKACELDRNILILCATSADPDGTGIQAIIADTKRTIAQAAYSLDFKDEHSSRTGYDDIAQKLRIIVSAGKLDIALELVNMVFNTCSNTIETYDYDGEVIGEVGEVAAVGVEALSKIDWAPAKKLIWAINSILHDNFGYCDCLYTFLRETDDLSAWTEVVSYLSSIQKHDLNSLEKEALIEISKLSLKKAGMGN